jgi:hypothetical protein
MAKDTPEYDIANIRELLTAAFTAKQLRRFCYDRSTFRPVVDEFAPDHGLADMVDQVIDYCHTHLLWDELLTDVALVRWRQYARFQPRLGKSAPPPVTARTVAVATLRAWPLSYWILYVLLLASIVVFVGLWLRPLWVGPGTEPMVVIAEPTWTGVIAVVEREVVVTPSPSPEGWEAYLAFEPYAWLDSLSWPATIGAPYEMEIDGTSLGRAPWIAVSIGLTNPSPDESQRITAASLYLYSFEPVSATSRHTLTIRTDLAPSFLIPQDCPQSGEPSAFARGFEPPDAEHLFGILPKSASMTERVLRGEGADWSIPPRGDKEYILFISARAPGKYGFSVDMELESTDRVTSTVELGYWEYAFLDTETALSLPMEFDGSRCPP